MEDVPRTEIPASPKDRKTKYVVAMWVSGLLFVISFSLFALVLLKTAWIQEKLHATHETVVLYGLLPLGLLAIMSFLTLGFSDKDDY